MGRLARFVQWPVFRTLSQALWRLALLPLVGGSLFLLATRRTGARPAGRWEAHQSALG